MNPNDKSLLLLRSIAYSPADRMAALLNPSNNFDLRVIADPVMRQVFGVLASESLAGHNPSLLSVLSKVRLSESDTAVIKAAWAEGKTIGEGNWQAIWSDIRNAYLHSEAHRVIADFNTRCGRDLTGIRGYLSTLSSQLANIANDGADYNPHPSAHKGTPPVQVMTPWPSVKMNEIFGGGVWDHNFTVSICPSGQGKSTLAKTWAVNALQLGLVTVIMTNELPPAYYTQGITHAMTQIYRESMSVEDIEAHVEQLLLVYDEVFSYEKMRLILSCARPAVSVIDSVVGVSGPQDLGKLPDTERLTRTGRAFLNLTTKYQTMLYAPGNTSKDIETALKGRNPQSVQIAMMYGSAAYHHASDMGLSMWNDHDYPQRQSFYRLKSRYRERGDIDQTYGMDFSPDLGIFIDPQPRRDILAEYNNPGGNYGTGYPEPE